MRIYSITNKHSKKWGVDYCDKDGKRIRKVIGPKKLAEKRLQQIREQLILGADTGDSLSSRISITDFADRYFEHAATTQTPMTLSQDKSRIKPLLEYFHQNGIKYLHQITPAVMLEFQPIYLENKNGHQKRSRNSWNHVLGLARTILNYAVDLDLLEHNEIARKPKRLKIEHSFNYFTEEECQAIIDNSEEPFKTAFLILLYTGMRRSELWHQRWRDVDLKRRFITIKPYAGFITKSGKTRVVPIPDELYQHLKKQKSDRSGYLWRPTSDIHASRKYLKKILEKPNRRGTLHDFRHTFASHHAMAGTPIPILQQALGHSDINTTMKYAHLSTAAQIQGMANLKYSWQKSGRNKSPKKPRKEK